MIKGEIANSSESQRTNNPFCAFEVMRSKRIQTNIGEKSQVRVGIYELNEERGGTWPLFTDQLRVTAILLIYK